jgi:hypothetical protein
MACDGYLYAEVAWEQLARIMNSSAGASYYLSDSKWTDTWYAELEGDQSKLERRGLRDIIIRPGTALMASPASPEDCRYRHFLLPNCINLRIAARTVGQSKEVFRACLAKTLPWYLTAIQGYHTDIQWCGLRHDHHVRVKASYEHLPWSMEMVRTS